MSWQILEGDAPARLRELPGESVQTCITSPPYWGLRDYGTATWDGGDPECDHKVGRFERPGLSAKQASNNGSGGDEATRECPKCGATRIDSQIGLEPTPEEYVANLVAVFREVRRVLRADATLWLNLGDSFGPGKQLVGIPWRVAFALQADGWILRSDIIWAKPNPMPESVTDRPTKAHEYLFLLTKSPRYFYDADAIAERAVTIPQSRLTAVDEQPGASGRLAAGGHNPLSQGGAPTRRDMERQVKQRSVRDGIDYKGGGQGNGAMTYPARSRNKRSVWEVSTLPFPGAHFATFPPKLIEPAILAGSPPGALVLDPFAGAGTTLLVAEQQGRDSVGIELNAEYAEMARGRLRRWEANPAGYLSGDPEPLPGQTALL